MSDDNDERIPFSSKEADALTDAVIAGCNAEGQQVTEFQVRELFGWASKVRADHTILELILKGKLSVSHIQHSVEETCNFNVSVRR